MSKNAVIDHSRLLVVADDPETYKSLKEVFPTCGIEAKKITDPLRALDRLRDSFYDLVLLDGIMLNGSTIDLISEITRLHPETKIIILTGRGDKETAIKALNLGAFDFLEKPLAFGLLAHSINRALETQKTEQAFKKMHEDLMQSRDDLLTHKTRLEQLNTRLMETNKALSVVAQNIERTRQETEKGIVLKIRSLIIPIIEKLYQDKNLTRHHGDLEMLISHVEDLTSGLATDTKILTSLTSTELRIASLIKNGLKTEEIAKHLYISPSTVKTHRKNIRTKLKIKNCKRNLMGYLRSTLAENMKGAELGLHR